MAEDLNKKTVENINSSDLLSAATVKEYLDSVASSEPAPGGGSALAVCGAMGVSLLCKVSSITLGSSAQQDTADALTAVLEQLEPVRGELVVLIDEDARAFAGVMEALHLPRATEQEKTCRADRLSAALCSSADVALDLAAKAAEVRGNFCDRVKELVSRSLGADVAIAEKLLATVCVAACDLARENLDGVKDMAARREREEKLETILKER